MQLDVHDTKRRIERAYESLRRNGVLPESEKEKIMAFDEFLAAKQFGEQRRLVYLLILPRIRDSLRKDFPRASKQDVVKLMGRRTWKSGRGTHTALSRRNFSNGSTRWTRRTTLHRSPIRMLPFGCNRDLFPSVTTPRERCFVAAQETPN